MGNKYRSLTPKVLADIAKQYNTKREFYEADPSAFVSASRKKVVRPVSKKYIPKKFIGPIQMVETTLLEEICKHMYAGRFKWTESMILNAAKPYKTRTDFAKGNKSAYTAARRRGLLEKACSHMPRYLSKKQRAAENV